MIVLPLKEGQDPGKSSDENYVKVTRTHGNQTDGEPYITAEFADNDENGKTFPVGDGNYYSRDGKTESRRKRRATCELTVVRCMLFTQLGFLLSKRNIYCYLLSRVENINYLFQIGAIQILSYRWAT